MEPRQLLQMQEGPVPEVGPQDVLVRVKAAGICHSDVHYRAGVSPVHPLPLTLGHEVAGVVEQVGPEVTALNVGDRVCLHYMVTCGDCVYCSVGSEQYGGLGMSAVQLAQAFGALDVYAVDINPVKLKTAEGFGATPVNAAQTDPVTEIQRLTVGRGVDVALELIGLPLTVRQAVKFLAVFGRAVVVGITDKPVEIETYQDVMCKEAELIGSSDHLASELPALIEFARRGVLDLSAVVTRSLTLDADAINGALDRLKDFSDQVRVVITP